MDENCNGTVCVRKCCPEGNIFDIGIRECAPVPEGEIEWKANFGNDSAPIAYSIISGMPLCDQRIGFEYEDTPEGHFFLLKNGSLSLPIMETVYSTKEYCLDHFFANESILTALVCLPPHEEPGCPNMSYVHGILLVVSCAFLLATLVVYMIIPSLRRSLYTRSLMCQVLSLLVGFLGVITSVFAFERVSHTSCTVIGVVTYFGLVSAFFWMNVLCFDMWSSFRNLLPPERNSSKRFARMSAYVWGCTFILCVVVVVMACLPETDATTHLLLPGFGINNCWFVDEKRKWAYFYSVVAILQVFNVFFFLHVAGILIKAQIDHSHIRSNTSRKKQKARLWIYLKLFIIMGIGWLSEIATSLEYNNCYFIILDSINALQGVFIFFVLICKKENIKSLENNISVLRSSINRLRGHHEEVPQGETTGDRKEHIRMKKRTFSESSTSCTLSVSEY
ncbi:G-protein coupled receptor Mth2-like [Oratosquilla oratoria]|uniref:G-protein coupled receptor Mth2-like n=1 Tax=Oratosquilla oratoria TaxID=337810 RepID=UPI003F75B1F3